MDNGAFNEFGYKFVIASVNGKPKQMLKLTTDLTYTYYINGVKNQLRIKAGFEFDGASIPAWATALSSILPFTDTIERFGTHAGATALHDFIWMYKGRMPVGFHSVYYNGAWYDAAYKADGKPVWTFTTSNKLFARCLREEGISKGTRRAMYIAVSSPIGYFNWVTGKLPDDARPKIIDIKNYRLPIAV